MLIFKGDFIACLPYSSIALFFEMTTIGLTWLVFKGEGYGNSVFCYLPLVSSVLISVSYPAMPVLSPIVATALTAVWFILAGGDLKMFDATQWFFFTVRYKGDAFVIAFPVIGWKPPWPMLYYLILKLPWGGGKPAYVLYTAAGGPENAGTFVWLLLTLKGYRIAGRDWGIYPINVPTVRLGPKAFWRWFDSLMPFRCDAFGAIDSGGRFVEGKSAGLPFIFWPFFLWIAGVIVDNPILDRIYRNHTFKKRCNGCGICVSYCPAERLRMVNGHPRAKGTCTLCLGCVNICPPNAMQMWFLTEYGRPYQPKWPSLVVKKKV